MFYNLNDVWTEQLAEISTALLNQFNTNLPLLLNVSTIRLFCLQQKELAVSSPLNNWKPLQDFSHYKYNSIAAQLFLLQQANLQLTFRSSDYLNNSILGGAKALTALLPTQYMRKFRTYLIKYNLIYQKQVISADSSYFCTWSQFRKQKFASYITTQKPPKFYDELRRFFTNNVNHSPIGLPTFDYDTGLPVQ